MKTDALTYEETRDAVGILSLLAIGFVCGLCFGYIMFVVL